MPFLRSWIAATLLLALALDADAARRRAAGRSDPSDAPAAWLWRHAYALHATEFPAPPYDLEPLREIVGGARVVGLGDGTHGTHEFYTTKLRMIDFLVRQMEFDVVAFEAPFPLFDRLNEYVQAGTGDPRALLGEANQRLFYRFWDVEEIIEVIEALRAYNASRGDRPPVHIAGADIYDAAGGVQAVLAYLRVLDADAATQAETEYRCIADRPSAECRVKAEGVRERLLSRQAEFESKTGVRPFREALQNATVVVQSLSSRRRDADMALNVQWLRENRSRSGRIIIWAHQEHVGKTESVWIPTLTMGWYLAEEFGSEYVAIGSLTASGSVLQWVAGGSPVVNVVPTPAEGSYESHFRTRPAVALLVPLSATAPAWLLGPAPYFAAGTGSLDIQSRDSLPAKLDAVVFIERTTPTRPLSH